MAIQIRVGKKKSGRPEPLRRWQMDAIELMETCALETDADDTCSHQLGLCSSPTFSLCFTSSLLDYVGRSAIKTMRVFGHLPIEVGLDGGEFISTESP